MTTTLTLTQAVYIGGILQNAGAVITVDDSLAGALISENKATRPADYGIDTKQDAQVIIDPVTNKIKFIINPKTGLLVPYGNYADGLPNVTLTNAIGTTETQFSFVTIKGGDVRPDSQLVIHLSATKAGSTSGTLILRFGPASGSYSTATGFGGQGGVTTQPFINHLAEIWNNGTLNSQLASPVAVGSGLGASPNAIVTGSVDTALDWNIYFGWLYGAAPIGGDSVTLRKFRVEIKN